MLSCVQFDPTQVFSSVAGNQEPDVAAPQKGTVVVDSNFNTWVFGKNNYTGTLAPGNVVALDSATDGIPWDINRLGTGSTVLHYMAGVAGGAIPTGQYGWFQIKGRANVVVNGASVNIAVGDSLKMVTATFVAVHDQPYSTAPTYPLGFLRARQVATTDAATIEVSIHCNGVM